MAMGLADRRPLWRLSALIFAAVSISARAGGVQPLGAVLGALQLVIGFGTAATLARC
jgi:hypothetical protein